MTPRASARGVGAGPVGAGSDPYVRLSPVEVAISWPVGRVPEPEAGSVAVDARAALEREVAAALEAGPTFVLFSGGRDSSAVLAVAAHVARREGLPLPTPVTLVYPGIADLDESSWQSLVLEHLGLTERVLVTIEGQGWLGTEAQASLLRRGLLWPPALHLDDMVLRHVAGGQVMTGEGGDEVLGPRRITPAFLLLHDRRPSRRLGAAVARAAVPPAVVGLRTHLSGHRHPSAPWLRGAAARAATWAAVENLRSPWSWAAATRAMLRARAPAVLEHNYRQVALDQGVHLHHPLRSPAFVHALARDGGFWGYRGRTHLMRVLFADLLPDALLARSTKASFDAARFTAEERDFVAGWDGEGLDTDLVEPEALRQHWLGENPSHATAALLHQVWLAQQGAPVTGSPFPGPTSSL